MRKLIQSFWGLLGFSLLLLTASGGTTPGQTGPAYHAGEPKMLGGPASSSLSGGRAVAMSEPDGADRRRIVKGYGRLPLSFEANQGQTDATVKFLSRGAGYTLFLTGDEAVLALKKQQEGSQKPGARSQKPAEDRTSSLDSRLLRRAKDHGPRTRDAVLTMRLVGANPKAPVAGTDELPGKSNYFIGNDSKKWRTNVSTFAKVKYQDVYPGVDLVYYGNQGQLEYDFVVAPGANPDVVAFNVVAELAPPRRTSHGARAPQAAPLRLAANGDLVAKLDGGELRFHKPIVYQPAIDGRRPRTVIDGRYRLCRHQVTFKVGLYDRTRPLVVDPALSYSTFLGGISGAYGYGIAVDSSGNAYVGGVAEGADFPSTAGAFQPSSGGAQDAFVTKFNADGSALLYSTYLGGTDLDEALGVALDNLGDAYVTGYTQSTDFPITPGAFQATCHDCGPADTYSAFVTGLNPSGSALVYSTFLGGSQNDEAQGIAVDSGGNAYVVGFTSSSDFPTTPGAFQTTYGAGQFDAFLTKLNSSGTLLAYSTYLSGSYGDIARAVAVDAIGDAFVTGTTDSTDFPTTPGAFQTACGAACNNLGDAFVTEFDPSGSRLVYSTYLGGSSYDEAFGIAVNASGNAYVTGETQSPDFPITPGAFQAVCAPYTGYNPFVTQLNPSGSALPYSTCLGDAGGGLGIALDGFGDAYVSGFTENFPFPATPGAFSARFGGGYSDAIATEINPVGTALIYSTYLGGTKTDQGNGIAVDAAGSVYVVGYTGSSNFPITPGAFETPAVLATEAMTRL
jgi:Beta-propeller repeat